MNIKILLTFISIVLSQFTFAAAGPRGITSGPAKGSTGFTVGVTVLYPASGRTFEGLGVRSSNGAGIKSSLKFESLPSPYIYVKRSKEMGFGFSLGYEMVLDSKLTGGTINNGGTKTDAVNYSLLNSMSLNIVHFGAEYRFRSLYFPVELLFIDPPKVTGETGSLGFRRTNGPGYSAGIGYHILNRFAVEVVYRTLTVGLGEFASATVFDDYGKLTSSEVVLGLSAHF